MTSIKKEPKMVIRLSVMVLFSLIAMIFNIAFNSFPPVLYPVQVEAQAPVCQAWPDVTKPYVFSWDDNSNNEDGFKIERKLNQGNYSQLGPSTLPNIQGGGDATMVQGVVANTYTYRVWAFNTKSTSPAPTNEICITVPPLVTAPASATNLRSQ